MPEESIGELAASNGERGCSGRGGGAQPECFDSGRARWGARVGGGAALEGGRCWEPSPWPRGRATLGRSGLGSGRLGIGNPAQPGYLARNPPPTTTTTTNNNICRKSQT